MTDQVDHPSHYSRWKMEPIEFIMINDLPGWLANVIKYTMRYDAKDGLQDLYKGRSYLDMKIRQLEGIPRYWEKPVAVERNLNLGAMKTACKSPGVPDLDDERNFKKKSICKCGVNVTSSGFVCWDDDCAHKQKSSGNIHLEEDRAGARREAAFLKSVLNS